MDDFLMWAGGIIVTGVFGLIGWFINMIFARLDNHSEKHDALETRFDAHRLYAAETFTTKNDVEKSTNRIMRQLERLEDKLDGRKPRHPPQYVTEDEGH